MTRIDHTIHCDSCGKQFFSKTGVHTAKSANAIILAARSEGWYRGHPKGSNAIWDFCPECLCRSKRKKK